MKLSVIIPVYRVETTLDRCVESVLSQNLPDMEVILVDDGSPDNCGRMCDAWAEKDSRIRTIHQQNRGLSAARNAGIDTAEGDYLTFVDSDDYLQQDTYPALMHYLEQHPQTELLEYPFKICGPANGKQPWTPRCDIYRDGMMYWMDEDVYTHCYACNKVYKRELIGDFRFPEGQVFEDAYMMVQLLPRLKLAATVAQGLYYYCQNPQGITARADGAALRHLLQPHVEMLNRMNAQWQEQPVAQAYYLNVLNIQMDVCELTGDAPIIPRWRIEPDKIRGKAKLKAIAYNLLGIKKLCKLNKCIHKIWRSH